MAVVRSVPGTVVFALGALAHAGSFAPGYVLSRIGDTSAAFVVIHVALRVITVASYIAMEFLPVRRPWMRYLTASFMALMALVYLDGIIGTQMNGISFVPIEMIVAFIIDCVTAVAMFSSMQAKIGVLTPFYLLDDSVFVN